MKLVRWFREWKCRHVSGHEWMIRHDRQGHLVHECVRCLAHGPGWRAVMLTPDPLPRSRR